MEIRQAKIDIGSEWNSGFPYITLDDSENNRCCNCGKLYDPENGLQRQNSVQWYDHSEHYSREIRIVEAMILVFEGLLHMNQKRISPLEDLSMCFDCLYNLSELYSNYRQFLERTASNSFCRKGFPECLLWPKVKKLVIDDSPESCTKNNEKPELDSLHTKSLEMTEEEFSECYSDTVVFKEEEISEDEQSINNDNVDDNAFSEVTDSDGDDYREADKIELVSLPAAKPELEPVQLPNGKWYMPKKATVLLKRYVDGDKSTLDLGKSRELYGKTITLLNGVKIVIPHLYGNRKLRQRFFRKTCSICQEIFEDQTEYKNHRRNHREKNQKKMVPVCCLQCGKTLSSKAKLRSHEMSVHGTEKPFGCEICGKRFPLLERLRAHIKFFHENTIEFRREVEKRKRHLKSRTRRKYVPWKIAHPDKLDEVTCDICNKTFSTKQIKNDHILLKHKNERRYGCKFCEKRFVRESHCKAHEEIHLGIRKKRRYSCNFCEKGYEYSKALKEHIATHHSKNPNSFMCEMCGKSFSVAIRLNKHKERVHETLERTHQCDICQNKFKTKEILTAHKKLHTNERPFLCPVCGQAFKLSKHLKKHTVTQHCIGSVANCQICSKGFGKLAEYEEHMKKGYHIKPKFLRAPTRKRNYNAPSYVKARMAKKLERQQKRREKELMLYVGELEVEQNEEKRNTVNDENIASNSNSNCSSRDSSENLNCEVVDESIVRLEENGNNVVSYDEIQMDPIITQVQFVHFTGIQDAPTAFYTFDQP